MIRYIKGEYLYYDAGTIIIETKAGLGFRVHVSETDSILAHSEGDEIALYTYMQVREDGMSLFGFADMEGLLLFEKLITVKGVGPRAGLAIMSIGTPGLIKTAIVSGDYSTIAQAQGVGKKTAERIILELKDKISVIPGEYDDAETTPSVPSVFSGRREEAVAALTTLGYTKKEAEAAVASVSDEGLDAEDYIRKSLKFLL